MTKLKAGVEAFRRGDFWQAHEDWECVWHTLEASDKRWLQGLIQMAAVFYHLQRNNPKPALRLASAALEKIQDQETCPGLGIQAIGVLETLRSIASTPPQTLASKATQMAHSCHTEIHLKLLK